jgi:transposase InsO family protein
MTKILREADRSPVTEVAKRHGRHVNEPGASASHLASRGLQVPRRRQRRRVALSRARPMPASDANHRWAFGFVEVSHGDRRVDARVSRDRSVRQHPARLVRVRGAPRCLRSDSGPEFISPGILRWLRDARIEAALIDPGRPKQVRTSRSTGSHGTSVSGYTGSRTERRRES